MVRRMDRSRLVRAGLLAGVAAVAGYALWWRRNPSACPYSQRFWVELPHPGITRERLRQVLAPVPGERMLEIGPGTGYYTLEIADRLSTFGRLDLVDIQRQMLDHTLARAGEANLRNIEAHEADARTLPFEDETFDGAFLVAVLGEIPDQRQAVRELARVLKPGGRVVVGEIMFDPHYVSHRRLSAMAAEAGLQAGPRVGAGRIGYYCRLDKPAAAAAGAS
jgi:ubiquinone/menaquinone biosynthesis C-methylase UbiE